MEQLRADVRRLSAELMTAEPLASFLEMRRVRARIFRVLDQQLWPRDQADLYFLLGCLADLMAAAAGELGYPQAAEELLRSGWAYATAIDHHPLMAHLRLHRSRAAHPARRPGLTPSTEDTRRRGAPCPVTNNGQRPARRRAGAPGVRRADLRAYPGWRATPP